MRAETAATKVRGFRINEERGHVTAEIEAVLHSFWAVAGLFAIVEVGTFLLLRKSFFEAVTDGEFEQWPRFERIVEVHVWTSVVMWCFAAVQILWQKPRKIHDMAWMHRRLGAAMLLTFYVAVLPTSLYLTLMQRIDYLAPAVGAVLLDTAFCTSYFLYRGWRVARNSTGPKSLVLHGRLMQCGVLMSMSILPQRGLQFFLTMQLHKYHQINYTVSILVTAILFVVYGHFWDGPRGGIWFDSIGAENAEEAYGTAVASSAERLAWKCRWVAYPAVLCFTRSWART